MADLTTVDNVKQYLGLQGTADDALLSRLITAISGLSEQFASRLFHSADFTETQDGKGTRRITVDNYPITAVASLSIDGVSISAAVGAAGSGYTFRDRFISLRGFQFTAGIDNVSYTYTAGLTSVPPEIENACIEWVGLCYREKDRIGHQSKTIAGETVTFTVVDMPKRVKTTLQQWMSVVPA